MVMKLKMTVSFLVGLGLIIQVMILIPTISYHKIEMMHFKDGSTYTKEVSFDIRTQALESENNRNGVALKNFRNLERFDNYKKLIK